MFSCGPIIGVVLAMPDSSVEIAYYQVTSSNFPDVQTILDVLVSLLGYASIQIVDGPQRHRYNPTTSDCSDASIMEASE